MTYEPATVVAHLIAAKMDTRKKWKGGKTKQIVCLF